MKITEKTLEGYLVREVQLHGGQAYKFSSPARRGVPDRLCVFPNGRVVFVEVKAPKGKVSPLQAVELRKLIALGQRAVVVRSVDDITRVVIEALAA